jgi:hypothetical protein
VQVIEVEPGIGRFQAVPCLADAVLDQRRHIVSAVETASENRVLGAFDGDRCLGFLRFYVQVVGSLSRFSRTHNGASWRMHVRLRWHGGWEAKPQ